MQKKDKEKFIRNYLNDLNSLSLDLEINTLIQISNCIIDCSNSNGTIYIVGNGGSASIASHVAIDFLKALGIRAMTFNESSLITCYANDFGYENWIKESIKSYSQKKDCVIFISSSGESSNILNGARFALENELNVITFSGFKKNNSLSSIGHFNIWVNSSNYNYVEILHNKFLLILVDLIKFNFNK